LGQLGRDACASILHENLKEEKAADQKLTNIAESQVNVSLDVAVSKLPCLN
jgi:ferritin-like metal-binding protein YciE